MKPINTIPYQATFINTKKACAICQNQDSSIQYPIAMVQGNCDSFLFKNHMVCNLCYKQLSMIRDHYQEVDNIVYQNKLKFGIGSSKGQYLIKFYMNPQKKSNSMIQQSLNGDTNFIMTNYPGYNASDQPFYNTLIQNLIRKNKLQESDILPINIRQLVYYCTTSILPSERHEIIRDTILRVMVGHALPIQEIKNISIIIQFLLCYLRDFEVYSIVGKLSQTKHQECEKWNQLFQDLQTYELFDFICHLLGKVSLVKNYKSQRLMFKKVNDYKKCVITDKSYSLSVIRGQTVKIFRRSSTNSPIRLDLKCNCKENYHIQTIKQLARMKNLFHLIINELLQEQKQIQSIMNEVQIKHIKQKSQYINQITSLKEKIRKLQEQKRRFYLENTQDHSIPIQNMRNEAKKNKRTAENKKVFGKRFSNIEQKKQTKNLAQSKIKIKNQSLIELKRKENFPDDKVNKLISETKIACFPKIMSENLSDDILQKIIGNIKSLQEQVRNLLLKDQQYQIEVKKLLEVLKLKQQKLMPLIQENNQITQKHQNVLCKLQNGLQMGENEFLPRVVSIRKLQYDLVEKEQQTGTQNKRVKKKKNITNASSQIKQMKKLGNESKQSCSIY